jgi:hypothetical protein
MRTAWSDLGVSSPRLKPGAPDAARYWWGGAWRVGRVTFEDERTGPPMEVLTHETARAEAHGSPDTRADRLVVAATVALVEPRCAGSASGGGRP